MISLASDRPASLRASMRWPDFRKKHPDAWVIVEVVVARDGEAHRALEQIKLVELCLDAETTVRRYRELRRADPHRELCFLHTAWEAELEERWQFSRELHDTVVTTV
jgi:hypothetical protein